VVGGGGATMGAMARGNQVVKKVPFLSLLPALELDLQTQQDQGLPSLATASQLNMSLGCAVKVPSSCWANSENFKMCGVDPEGPAPSHLCGGNEPLAHGPEKSD